MNRKIRDAIKVLPGELIEQALTRFVEVNPHYNGADWWDVMEILFDSDAHLDITEVLDPYTVDAAVEAITRHWATR